MMTLDDYLVQNPWQVQWKSLSAPVDYFFTYELALPARDVWARLAGISVMNGKPGGAQAQFTERDGKLYGHCTIAGVVHEWEEVPRQWEYGREIRAERIYSRGVLHYMRMHCFIEDKGPSSSAVFIYSGWIPRNAAGRVMLSLDKSRTGRRFGKILSGPARGEEPERPGKNPSTGSAVPGKKRIRDLRAAIASVDQGAEVADALVSWLERAPLTELSRIRPRHLAYSLGTDEAGLIAALLHTARAGLTRLSWDVVCPHCRCVRGMSPHLRDVPRIGSCDYCGISFDTSGLDGIEVSVGLNRGVNRSREFLCGSPGPAGMPNVLVQKLVQPGDSGDTALAFGEGRFRLRLRGRVDFMILDVREGNEAGDVVWTTTDAADARLERAPGSVLRMQNLDRTPHTFIVEKAETDNLALRPADLFTMQVFRDLFPGEAPPPDLFVDAGVQTVMFAEIVGATGLCSREGNAGALRMVRAFLRDAHAAAYAYNGAVIRSISDVVLFAFARPRDALTAAMDLASRHQGDGPDHMLGARVSINHGPCLAVNLCGMIDYFGHTVNIAARLGACASAGEIVVAEGVVNDREAGDYLARKGLDLSRPREAQVEGVGAERYWKFRAGRKKKGSGAD
jgi:class 3 adenylate cyclase